MFKKALMIVAATSLVFGMSGTDAVKPNNTKMMKRVKQMKSSPFLIVGKMPHLTRLIKIHWDDPNLALSNEQKSKLLKIRKETIATVMKLTKKIGVLENEIAKSTMQGEEPKNIKPKVEELAKLKAKATMAHIRCIYDTKKVLTKKQLDYLLSMKKR
ncbi:hypothetical protein [Nitrosophilus labii]|uniref:hypothetical protein n=1 Tax=Nitrosophilus labii TaxID=2706014 RepID=UPI001656D6AF|nr:hypothetical protein [Nitrosophilus labii]